MRGKIKAINAVLVAMLVFSVFLAIPVQSQVTAEMYIEPALIDGTLDIGDTFTVAVMLKDFVNCFGWGVVLSFDPNVLQCSAFRAGPLLADDIFDVLAPGRATLFMLGAINNIEGLVTLTSVSLTGAEGVTGEPGVGYKLVEYDFEVGGYTGSTSLIHLKDPSVTGGTYWADPEAEIQLCIYTDAEVETIPAPAPYGPTAKFTWYPTLPKITEEVTFDASASTGGFDGTAMCPITEYRWDFDGDLVFEVTVGTAITKTTFADPGAYDVTLEVYAPETTVEETHRVTHTVTVVPPPIGADIDLYHSKPPFDGKGPNEIGDSFAPQELVMLFAYVTYNDDPVEGKLVAFEVKDASGAVVTFRTATTDASGIAMSELRIPSMPVRGSWLAIAIVDVAGTTVGDTLPFEVGWIIEILVPNTEVSTYKKCEDMYFILKIRNIALVTVYPTITVVTYDECGVPIGQVVITDWAIEADTTADYKTVVSVHVPNWAFVGIAMVYANAFTALPQEGGVPYCPEASADFIIAKG